MDDARPTTEAIPGLILIFSSVNDRQNVLEYCVITVLPATLACSQCTMVARALVWDTVERETSLWCSITLCCGSVGACAVPYSAQRRADVSTDTFS